MAKEPGEIVLSTSFVVPAPPVPSVAVAGTDSRFPVHRIYCVGRNYSEHVKEMGGDPTREPPIFFTKPADAVVPSDTPVAYPPRTSNLHHEIELVVAMGRGGRDIAVSDALGHVFGYAVGNDLTRRDLQAAAKKQGGPWDAAKGFDASAPITPIRPVADIGHVASGRIWLEVNGELRQQSDIAEMIWSVPEVIAELSTYFELQPGDLIFTGTPAGVGVLLPGDLVAGGVDGVATLQHGIVAT
jgi:fumarylpyruvate hydrolase